jgi:hypothetical protein
MQLACFEEGKVVPEFAEDSQRVETSAGNRGLGVQQLVQLSMTSPFRLCCALATERRDINAGRLRTIRLFLILVAAENTAENTPANTNSRAVDWSIYRDHLDPSSISNFRLNVSC